MVEVVLVHPLATLDHFGPIPDWLNEDNPKRAVEQLDDHYHHGGGWRPMKGFEMLEDNKLKYPGDPPLSPLGLMKMRDELIIMYEYAIVCVVQPDGTFEAARMD